MKKHDGDFIKKPYLAYFGRKILHQNKHWAPHKVCSAYVEILRKWIAGKLEALSFGVRMIWRKPTNRNHIDDCYFCSIDVKVYNSKIQVKNRLPNCRISYETDTTWTLNYLHLIQLQILMI